jgi:prephenate dehydrogenase
MVGGTGSGFRASEAELFRGARAFLVRGGASRRAADTIFALWQTLGADPQWVDASDHDRTMAWCSHLPQLVSNALAGALEVEGFEVDSLGPGGKDMVRLAASNPLMWRDLFQSSGPEVAPALRSVARALESIADLLEAGDADAVASFMDRTRLWKRQGSLSPLAPPPDSVGVVNPQPAAPAVDRRRGSESRSRPGSEA